MNIIKAKKKCQLKRLIFGVFYRLKFIYYISELYKAFMSNRLTSYLLTEPAGLLRLSRNSSRDYCGFVDEGGR